LQLLMELEETKRKQQEYAAEQVRKVKVSSGCHSVSMHRGYADIHVP